MTVWFHLKTKNKKGKTTTVKQNYIFTHTHGWIEKIMSYVHQTDSIRYR